MFKFGSDIPPCVLTATENAPEPVRFAVDELRRYLGRILGTPISSEASERAPRVVVDLVDDDDLGDEGYELVCESREFRIEGGGPAGAVYGTYEFLRRHCGCQFSGLGPEGEHVPRLRSVEIPEGRLRRKPKLWYRGMQAYLKSTSDLDVQRFDWMAKNGMNYVMITPVPDSPSFKGEATFDPKSGKVIESVLDDRYTNRWFRDNWLPEIRKRGLKVDMNHHNLFYWLPPDRYFDDHPEWYPLVNGERGRKAHQLCLCGSNDEAVETLIANVKAYLAENPEVKIVGVIPEDGRGWCMCEDCRREDETMDAAFGTGVGGALKTRDSEVENPSLIRRNVRLVNRVARAVRDAFPDVLIGSAHYSDLVFAPRGIKLEPNVVPWIAMYWRCGAHALTDPTCPINDAFLYELKKWRAAHDGRLILYEYYMGMYAQMTAPYPIADVLCEEWPELRKLGIDGATVQSVASNHDAYALNYLAFARLGWEDFVDYDRLLDDFLLGMYGSQAAEIRPIHEQFKDGRDHCETTFPTLKGTIGTSENKTGCVFPNVQVNLPVIIGKKGFDPIDEHVEKAMAATDDERERLQIRRLKDAVEYWRTLHDVAPLFNEIREAEARIGRLAAQAWLKLEEGLAGMEDLQRAGWMNTGVNAGHWLSEARAKSSTSLFIESGEIFLRAVAGRPVTLTVTCDGIGMKPESLAPGRVANWHARRAMRIDVDDASAVSLTINGEPLWCHEKQVTIDVEWREFPKRANGEKLFCSFRGSKHIGGQEA